MVTFFDVDLFGGWEFLLSTNPETKTSTVWMSNATEMFEFALPDQQVNRLLAKGSIPKLLADEDVGPVVGLGDLVLRFGRNELADAVEA